MKILLPVDGSDYTQRMLGYIAAHEELFGPGHDYCVLHVVAPLPVYATRFLDRSTIDDYYREESEAVLRPVREFARQLHWKAECMHACGHAADAIASTARDQHADLIVMGSHGRSALGGVVLGSVASGVLARCKVPVMLVR